MNNNVKSPDDESLKKSTVSTYRTKENDNVACFESSTVSIYYYFYSIKNNGIINKEYCNSLQYPVFRENFDKWIQFLFKPSYLKIIYYLIENEYCHASGLVRTLHEDIGNINKQILTLVKYGIIKTLDKEKYNRILYKHRKAFRIDDYHFEKAEWYKLTDIGFLFYSKLDYSISLNQDTINNIKNWKISLSKKIKEVEEEIKKQDIDIGNLLEKYKHIKERPDLDPLEWARDKIKRGIVKGFNPNDLIFELEKKIQDKSR